ncbi:CidA/LrgA family protein [Plasticicumulans acidivorans]|uniref:Holin-like protein n=1 Tax=Plasticicumulans acidivorans TaxID=886464 RepID=A0A317MW69_9GAMM|nr:CidA/LrgA family protein [Plasticicumulans acidivorans]PWV63115.1 holin-like protein [Plasticicumulans acidivorans]
MSIDRLSTRLRYGLRRSRVLQVVLLAALWWGADALVRRYALPLPGGVLGMLLLLALLASGQVSGHSLRRGAGWLLAEMLLFFVPAVMALLDHGALLRSEGLQLVAVIVFGTVIVMTGTALTVEACCRWSERRAG